MPASVDAPGGPNSRGHGPRPALSNRGASPAGDRPTRVLLLGAPPRSFSPTIVSVGGAITTVLATLGFLSAGCSVERVTPCDACDRDGRGPFDAADGADGGGFSDGSRDSADAAGFDAGPPEPVALDAFCDRYLEARCRGVDGCGCAGGEEARCEAHTRSWCPDFVNTARTRIDDGSTLFDPEAAGRFLEHIAASTARCLDGQVVGVTLRHYLTMHGAFAGTLERGAVCERGWPATCRNGNCGCRAGTICDTVFCQEWRDLGEACFTANAFESACLDQDQILDDLAPVAQSCMGGVCTARPIGDPCTDDADCASFHCLDGFCIVPLEDGSACDSSSACANRICDSETHRCSVGREVGEPCGTAVPVQENCASRLCGEDGRCASDLCGHFEPLTDPAA